jgi:hypothetical protein
MHKEIYFHIQNKVCYILRQAVPLNQKHDSEQLEMEDIRRQEISGKK